MSTQSAQIVTYDYGASLPAVTLRNKSTDAVVATADSCNEVSVDSGVYLAVFGEASLIPAGEYRLRAVIGGRPLNRYVTLAGVDAEVVVSVNEPGSGGGLTVEQQDQLDRIESQTSKLSGTPVTVNGNVKPGGQIVLKQGDDHTVALGNPVIVPVDDVGGALHTLMAAVGVGNLSVVAIRGVDPASRVSGTVAALSYSSNVLSVTMQFTAAETVKGVVGPAYNYDVIKTDTPTRTYFSGRLTLTRDAR